MRGCRACWSNPSHAARAQRRMACKPGMCCSHRRPVPSTIYRPSAPASRSDRQIWRCECCAAISRASCPCGDPPDFHGSQETASMATNNNGSSSEVATTGTFRSNIGEAGTSLKQAAVDTGDALKNAAVAAGEELRVGKANLKADLADTALAGIAAAEVAGG